MSVIADSQKNDIKIGELSRRNGKEFLQVGLMALGIGNRIFSFGGNRVNVGVGKVNAIEPCLTCHELIALGIRWGDIAFVSPKDVNFFPGKVQGGEGFIQGFGGAATRQGDGTAIALLNRFVNFGPHQFQRSLD